MNIGLFRRINLLIKSLPSNIKVPVFRYFGMHVGSNSRIGMGVLIDNPQNIIIGDNCFLNSNIGLYSGAGKATISIGNNVWIGMDTKFICPTHEIGSSLQRAGTGIYKSISIGSGCWIGANVTILPGVTVGDGCIIAAGAVVAGDCEPNYLYGGVPAKKIKCLKQN